MEVGFRHGDYVIVTKNKQMKQGENVEFLRIYQKINNDYFFEFYDTARTWYNPLKSPVQ